jgi:UDP-glucose-4-epimerase GalE
MTAAGAILVTGGAGYVGSVLVRALAAACRRVVVLDDLSAGHRDAIDPSAAFVQADVRDGGAVARAVADHDVGAVVHFAGRLLVGESVAAPRKYWRDNVVAAADLLDAVLDAGVRTFVFSSSAAVYGDPVRAPIDEDHPTVPTNPYGDTKLAVERMLATYGRAYGLRWVALRYFNAAGAEPDAGLGERHEPETHLVPLALEAAARGRELTVFGSDLPTPDGTCVRDYVHVTDLAAAHLAALEREVTGPVNLGTGAGHSVLEVIRMVERVTGRAVPVRLGARRAGDPPVLVASCERARELLGWRPARRLEVIVRDAWRWHLTRGHP